MKIVGIGVPTWKLNRSQYWKRRLFWWFSNTVNSCKVLVDSKPAEKMEKTRSHAKQQTLICLHTEKWWKSNLGHLKCSALFSKSWNFARSFKVYEFWKSARAWKKIWIFNFYKKKSWHINGMQKVEERRTLQFSKCFLTVCAGGRNIKDFFYY